jgi:hypothetical protein
MTKAEYNSKLLTIQQELATKVQDEDRRHNTAIGALRSDYRKKIAALQAEYHDTADEANLRDHTIMRPA